MSASSRFSEKLLMWLSVLAAPGAWSVQFFIGFGSTVAACNPGGAGWGLPLVAGTIVLTVLAAAVAVVGLLSAISLYRATRAVAQGPPPGSRVHFFSAVGLVISPLFLIIIVLNGIGVAALRTCIQG